MVKAILFRQYKVIMNCCWFFLQSSFQDNCKSNSQNKRRCSKDGIVHFSKNHRQPFIVLKHCWSHNVLGNHTLTDYRYLSLSRASHIEIIVVCKMNTINVQTQNYKTFSLWLSHASYTVIYFSRYLWNKDKFMLNTSFWYLDHVNGSTKKNM